MSKAQPRWRGPCAQGSALTEGALCPWLSPDGGGPVLKAQPRWRGPSVRISAPWRGPCVRVSAPWRGPCVRVSALMEGALCPQPTLGASRLHPPLLPLPAPSSPFLLAASHRKKPPLTLPGTVFSQLLCLNLKSACSVFRHTWLTKSAWEMSRYEKNTSYQALQNQSLCHNDKVNSRPGALRGGEQGSALTPEPPALPVPGLRRKPHELWLPRRSLQQRRPLRLGFRSLEFSLSQLT